jgi:hypothetical protein
MLGTANVQLMVPIGRDERSVAVQAVTVHFPLFDVTFLIASPHFAVGPRPNRGHDLKSGHSGSIPLVDFADELVLEFSEVITESARVVYTDLRAQL